MNYKYTSLSKKGKDKEYNEDSIGIKKFDDGILCVVCDGVGGGFAGERASEVCVESILNYFSITEERNYLTKISESMNLANAVLYEISTSREELHGMTTTSDVFYLNNHTLYWGHIGDSRIYDLINGKLYQLTKDHSLIQQMVDSGYLSMRDASKSPNKNVILNALGEDLKVEFDVSKVIIHPEDKHRFMICSDGVNAVLDNSEMEEILNIEDIEECIRVIDKKVQAGGYPDDYSVILIEGDR
jgi:serine/threonine protein phosphatase PrpC